MTVLVLEFVLQLSKVLSFESCSLLLLLYLWNCSGASEVLTSQMGMKEPFEWGKTPMHSDKTMGTF